MAGTRRTVERLGALLVSVTISVLIFLSLMTGKNSVGGSRHGGHSDVLAWLLPNSLSDSLVTEEVSVARDSVIDSKETDDLLLPSKSPDSLVSGPDDGADAAYLPASMLTQRPIVLVDIHPELPEAFKSVDPQFVDLLLLINAYGDVDQVRLLSVPALSASMVEELRQHFQVMRFMPGQWEGQAVPSALRIRVQLHP